ncbi:uncharacterized protein DNG_00379 [Cephalotrichum gorgonifer]|uniref:DUF7053 domain-containing protein n=1 Tax=Cephalotrichum gorgonifer TaxID=2041049 RepID=A0AAE8SQS5_9PEZI|nr:uncharacterized protein DNG_00379 [Cephalotrichum gorgonifer]
MCFHKSIKYTCAHTFFTICIRTCHVQDEYLIDPEGCTPCDIKTSHALYTIAVDRRCDACLRLDARVGDMKAVLKGARAKVDEMLAIRDSANELWERNDKEVLEKGAAILNTTTTLKFTTPLPPSIPAPKAIATLQNHETFIKCDPHMISFKSLPPPLADAVAVPPSRVCSPRTQDPTQTYEVTDRVHALPAGLWDSDVVSTTEITNLERGIFARLRSPMGIVMETVWEITEMEGEGGGLEMVEETVISCSRLLSGVVKGQCQANWKGIHAKLVRIMNGEEEV